MRLLPGLLTIGVSARGIPQYGPTRGDRCLTPNEDDTGKYTMNYSIESENAIVSECEKNPDCDIVVKFSKPQLFGSQGMIDQTYFEMGSTQSRPCSHKSPKVNSMEIAYTKKGSQFRANQVPTYGPVGVNNCIGPGDRPYENYSMLKNFESLSLAKKYCQMYPKCDIIVEIDRNQVANRSLRKLYEIGNTKSNNICNPRPQRGVKVSRVPFYPNEYRSLPIPTYAPSEPVTRPFRGNQGQGFIHDENVGFRPTHYPKRREATQFKCLQIGEKVLINAIHKQGCLQVFDTITTANLACSLFEDCSLIGQNTDGNFELFSESDDITYTDLEDYNLSIPTMDKTQTDLIYDFTTILNHENMAITQITAYDPIMDISFIEVPKHGSIPESTHLNFYNHNLSVVIQENTCVIRHTEQTEKLNGHMATTIDYKIEKQHGNLDVEESEYSLSDLSYFRDDLPPIAKKQCYGKALIGLDFDLKELGHETESGAKFFFMNETENLRMEDSLSRSKRVVQKEKVDPVTNKLGKIVECNAKKACGNEIFMAAVCAKESCGTLFCKFVRRPNVATPGGDGAVIEAPFASWNHIIEQGYWCMPCCILEDNIHAKMKACSAMPLQKDICKQQNIHGRCGIEFDP